MIYIPHDKLYYRRVRRFWSYVNKTDTCWLLTGAIGLGGHGRFELAIGSKRRVCFAHRIAYELYHGEIPLDLQILHKPIICNNRLCVRNEHIYAGTSSQNRHDMIASGSQRGSRHPRSKLTEEQVLEIRSKYHYGIIGLTTLGKEYNVDHSTIEHIINKKSWTHI